MDLPPLVDIHFSPQNCMRDNVSLCNGSNARFLLTELHSRDDRLFLLLSLYESVYFVNASLREFQPKV